MKQFLSVIVLFVFSGSEKINNQETFMKNPKMQFAMPKKKV